MRVLSGFETTVKHCRGLVQIMLLPYLQPDELAKFSMLNVASFKLLSPNSPHCVNYIELYKSQGIKMDSEQEASVHKSLSAALKCVIWPKNLVKVKHTTKD